MTKKRLLITISVIIVMMLSAFSLVACKKPTPDGEGDETPPVEETDGNKIPDPINTFDFELNEDGTGYIITGIGSKKDIKSASIPEVYGDKDDKKPVVEIADNAFVYAENVLTSIYVHGDNLKKIGNGAFSNSSGIKTMRLSNTLTSIGDYAFKNCSALIEADLPESVESIGNGAFLGCSKLAKVVIPSKITNIGEQTFMGCSALRNEFTNKEGAVEGLIVKSNKIVTIGNEAFRNCSKLADVSMFFTEQLTTIGAKAFMGCTDLVGKAQSEDSKVKELVIPKNIVKIQEETFRACTKLAKVVFNDELLEIGEKAFMECKSIKAVEFPNSLKIIGKHAFEETSSLENVILNDGLETIDDYAFAKSSGNGFDDEGNHIYTGLSEIVVPNSVKVIGKFAFTACYNLQKVTFGTGIEYIAEGAFRMSGKNGITFNFEGNSSEWQALVDGGKIEMNFAWGCDDILKINVACKDGVNVEMTFATKTPEQTEQG